MARLLERLWVLVSVLLVSGGACATPRPRERPPVRLPAVEPARVTFPTAAPGQLYSAQEALSDALSGELEYIGTGRWPGVERSRACAFRNRRVVIVNAYCTLNETHAARIDVFSPQRGRVRISIEHI